MQINWYPGHMAKAKRLLQDQLSRVDAVIEICDARLPESSRNPVLNAMLRACAKRPVSYETLERAVSSIEQSLFSSYDREIPSARPLRQGAARGRYSRPLKT